MLDSFPQNLCLLQLGCKLDYLGQLTFCILRDRIGNINAVCTILYGAIMIQDWFYSTQRCWRIARSSKGSSWKIGVDEEEKMLSSASYAATRWSTRRGTVHKREKMNVSAPVSCFSTTCTVTGFILHNRAIPSRTAFSARYWEATILSLLSSHRPWQWIFVLSSCTVMF